jgi:uncharacterized protein (DUF305 family)
MNKLTPIFIAGSLVISAGLAIAKNQMNNDNPMQGHDMTGMDVQIPAFGKPSTKAYLAVNDRMHKDMMIAFTGDADIDFMRGMIPHHQGAIDMATVELQFGKDSETRQLAERIIAAQQQQIAEMNAWLAKHP